MPFRTGLVPPAELRTSDFYLRPITADDAERDFAAVMESREYLRFWEQSTWPRDDFTVQENREDLESLERRHKDHVGFTYTVLDPAQQECLGCVYLLPADAPSFTTATITPLDGAEWGECEAAVYFWVRKSQMALHTDVRLLEALRSWLASEWDLAGYLFVTNEQFVQQVDLFERRACSRTSRSRKRASRALTSPTPSSQPTTGRL